VKALEKAPFSSEAVAKAALLKKARDRDSDSSSERYDPLAHSDSSSIGGSEDDNGEPKLSAFTMIKNMLRLKARQETNPNYFGPKNFVPKT